MIIVKVGPDILSKITCLEADMPLIKQAIKLGQLRRTRDGIDYSHLAEVEIEAEHQKWLSELGSPSQSEHDISKETVIFRPTTTQSPTTATPAFKQLRTEGDGGDVDMKDPNATNVSQLDESEIDPEVSQVALPDLDASSMEVNYDDSEQNITY